MMRFFPKKQVNMSLDQGLQKLTMVQKWVKCTRVGSQLYYHLLSN